MSAAAIDACNCVALTNVVGREDPFHRTTDEETKPVPFTVSVNAALPAYADAGDREVTTGGGFTDASTITTGLVAARV